MDFDVAQNSYFETFMTVPNWDGVAFWNGENIWSVVFNCEGHMFCWKKILGSTLSNHALVSLPAPYQISLVDVFVPGL
jgi:hypothetical protein